jgi:hypothetical protein
LSLKWDRPVKACHEVNGDDRIFTKNAKTNIFRLIWCDRSMPVCTAIYLAEVDLQKVNMKAYKTGTIAKQHV